MGKKGCGVAQLVARRLAVRQARVRFSALHHREGLPTKLSSNEEMERGPSEWRWINVLYECEMMKWWKRVYLDSGEEQENLIGNVLHHVQDLVQKTPPKETGTTAAAGRGRRSEKRQRKRRSWSRRQEEEGTPCCVLLSRGSPLLRDERCIGGWGILRIFDLHTGKAIYKLKVVLLNFWRVNVKTIRGFMNIPLADLSHINLTIWYDTTTNTNTVLLVDSDSISQILSWQLFGVVYLYLDSYILRYLIYTMTS